MASPIPLLAPVTTARFPVSPRSMNHYRCTPASSIRKFRRKVERRPESNGGTRPLSGEACAACWPTHPSRREPSALEAESLVDRQPCRCRPGGHRMTAQGARRISVPTAQNGRQGRGTREPRLLWRNFPSHLRVEERELPKHDVEMSIPTTKVVLSADVVFEIRSDDEKLGELRIGKRDR